MTRNAKKEVPDPAGAESARRIRYFEERKQPITETVRQLVEVESPSDNKQAVDRMGTLATMPCRIISGQKLSGPGSFDMKSGIAIMLHAIEALRTWHGDQL